MHRLLLKFKAESSATESRFCPNIYWTVLYDTRRAWYGSSSSCEEMLGGCHVDYEFVATAVDAGASGAAGAAVAASLDGTDSRLSLNQHFCNPQRD